MNDYVRELLVTHKYNLGNEIKTVEGSVNRAEAHLDSQLVLLEKLQKRLRDVEEALS